MIDLALGPVRLYAGAQPGVGHERSRREVEVRVGLVFGPTVLKTSIVLARI